MILVTGATGTVGSLVVAALRAQGREVRAMIRNAGSVPADWDAGVRSVVADFDDAASLDAAVAGVEAGSLALPAAHLDAWRVDGLIELYGFYATGYATATSDAVPVLSGRPARSFADFVAARAGVFR